MLFTNPRRPVFSLGGPNSIDPDDIGIKHKGQNQSSEDENNNLSPLNIYNVCSFMRNFFGLQVNLLLSTFIR